MGDDSDTNDKTDEIAEEAEGVLGEDTDSEHDPLLTLDSEDSQAASSVSDDSTTRREDGGDDQNDG
jgi:hypothetical protein